MNDMDEMQIAPCGMNCSLCVSYQFSELKLNKQGFQKKGCPGCVPRGKHCTYMSNSCKWVGEGLLRFCHECEVYPCKRLQTLDKRYRKKYHMSMIQNLENIKEKGMDKFLSEQAEQWRCPECGGLICCHNGLCLTCHLDTLLENKKSRWNEEEVRGRAK